MIADINKPPAILDAICDQVAIAGSPNRISKSMKSIDTSNIIGDNPIEVVITVNIIGLNLDVAENKAAILLLYPFPFK